MFKGWMIAPIFMGMFSTAYAEVLTLPDALREARANNPDIRQAQALMQVAKGERLSAGVPANPEIEAEIGADNEDDDVLNLEIRQPIAPIGTRHLQRGMAVNEVRIQEWNAQRVWAKVAADVQTAYAQAALVRKQTELLKETWTAFQKFLALIDGRYQSGEIMKSDLQRGRIEAAQVENEYLTLQNEHRKSLVRLNLLIGRPADSELAVEDVLKEESLRMTLDELRSLATAQRPDLQIADLELDSARKNLLNERRSRWPSWSVGLQRTEEDSDEDYAVLLGVNIPLWDLNSGSVRKAVAQVDAQTIRQDWIRQEVAAEVYMAFLDAETASRRMTISAEFRTGSEDILESAHERYSTGSIEFMDYRDQIRTAAQANAAYYQSVFDMNAALNELERVIHASVRQEEGFDEKD